MTDFPVEYYRAIEVSPTGKEFILPRYHPNDAVTPYFQTAKRSCHIASLGGQIAKGYTYVIDTLVVTDSQDVTESLRNDLVGLANQPE